MCNACNKEGEGCWCVERYVQMPGSRGAVKRGRQCGVHQRRVAANLIAFCVEAMSVDGTCGTIDGVGRWKD